MADRIDIIGDRGVALDWPITHVGVDWSSATFRAQVRGSPNAPGSPIFDLSLGAGITLQYAGSDTVANHVTAGRLPGVGDISIYNYVNPATGAKYASGDTIAVSIVNIGIDSDGMSGADQTPPGPIPYPKPRDGDMVLAWDMLVDADGSGSGKSAKEYFGDFVVRGTVVR